MTQEVKSDKELFSVEGEVALQDELQKKKEGQEGQQPSAAQELTSTYYSSVAFEPGSETKPSEEYQRALRELENAGKAYSASQAFWNSYPHRQNVSAPSGWLEEQE